MHKFSIKLPPGQESLPAKSKLHMYASQLSSQSQEPEKKEEKCPSSHNLCGWQSNFDAPAGE